MSNLCSLKELKDITNNFAELSIEKFISLIESKSNNEYVIIKNKMFNDFKRQLFKNNMAVFEIQRFLNDISEDHKENETTKNLVKDIYKFLIGTWDNITESNRMTEYRWAKELKEFESKE